MTRGTAPRVLPPETVVVLAPGGGELLEPDQLAGPACLCPGADGDPVDGLQAGPGAALWFVRWVDQAEVAICLPAGDVPVFVELRRTLERLVRTRLEVMPPANQLPA
jgi:hypothetical protein